MTKKKNVAINFYQLQQGTREGEYGKDFFEEASRICIGSTYSFTSNGEIFYSAYEAPQTLKHKFMLIGLVNAKDFAPVVITSNNDGVTIQPPSVQEKQLAGITFLWLDSETKSILTLSQSGVGRRVISDFVRHICGTANVSVASITVLDTISKVLDWEYYSKVELQFIAKTKQKTFDILDSSVYGQYYELMRHLEGIGINYTITAGSLKALNTNAVRSMIRQVMSENYVKKFVVTGKQFNSKKSKKLSYDLCACPVKYTTEITLTDKEIPYKEAGRVLYEAFYNKIDEIKTAYTLTYEEEICTIVD